MNSRNITSICALVTLLAFTCALNWLAAHAAPSHSAIPGASRRVIVRELAADWFWLKANRAWETRAADEVRGLTAISATLAPDEMYFRINAARMRAFDFPAWREASAPDAPLSVRSEWHQQAGREGLEFLFTGSPASCEALVEAGAIALYARRDVAAAVDYFRRAAELPGAPWYAGRIHAELLHTSGRTDEAVAWLRDWLPKLPADDPEAQRTFVQQRLAEWELELTRHREAL